MNTRMCGLAVGAFLALGSLCSQAADRYVQPGGSGTKDGSSWTNAFPTITAGLQGAKAGDTVNVWVGVYRERVTLPAGVRLVGGYGEEEGQIIWAPTFSVIDGESGGSVVTVATGADPTTLLSGFTIQNGSGTPVGGASFGGGIYISNASPSIQRNLIVNNHADVGGGVYMYRSASSVYYNKFEYNTSAGDGGGLASEAGNPRVQLNGFRYNVAERGGGLSTTASLDSFIASNIFVRNRAATLGSAALLDRGRFQNNTVAYHSTPAAVAIADGGTVAITNNIIVSNAAGVRVGTGATATIRYNDVFDNAGGNYTGVADPTGQAGNISVDPALADPYGNDFYPVPGSPVVDRGDASVVQFGAQDYYGYNRILGVTVDMGAVEWYEPPPLGAVRVKPASQGGSDANDGSDWGHAKATVQAAIVAAQGSYREVWVAAGTYNEVLRIEDANVLVYGGFAGTETARNQRDPSNNVTILHAGGLNASAVTITAAVGADPGINANTVVDGFTIGGAREGGIHISNASPVVSGNIITGNRAPRGGGGGILVRGGSPYIAMNTVRGNSAGRGGGVDVEAAHPQIRHNTIDANSSADTAEGTGGGLYIVNTVGDPEAHVTDNTITGNRALQGGGLYLGSGGPIVVRGNTISGNSISGATNTGKGGGIFATGTTRILNNIIKGNVSDRSGGAIEVTAGAHIIANNLIYRNTAPMAGGVVATGADVSFVNNTVANNADAGADFQYGAGAFTVTVANNILAYNGRGLAGQAGPSATFTESNNIVWANTVKNFDGLTPSPTDIIADPLFVNPAADDYHLGYSSPARDAGSNSVVQGNWLDMDVLPRVIGPTVDIGAYEYMLVIPVGMRNVEQALRIAGGLEAATPAAVTALNVEKTGASANRVDLADAIRLAREVNGLT